MKSYRRKRMNKKKIIIAACILCFVALAILFGIYDLNISMTLYNPNSRWASAFQLGGKLAAPVILLAGLNFVCWNRNQLRPHRIYNIIDEIFILVTIILILIFCGGFRGWWQEIVVAVIYLSLYLLIQFKARRLTWQQRRQLEKIIVMSIVAALIMLIIVECLKNLIDRPRFRNLSDLSEFVPWHKFNSQATGRSFPSGHTANSCGIIGILLAAQMFRDKWKRVVIGALPIIYILIMAVSRIIMGAHYASDTLISLALIALVWLAVCKLFGYQNNTISKW